MSAILFFFSFVGFTCYSCIDVGFPHNPKRTVLLKIVTRYGDVSLPTRQWTSKRGLEKGWMDEYKISRYRCHSLQKS